MSIVNTSLKKTSEQENKQMSSLQVVVLFDK